jgi:CDP-4-dehydro-6-deoxyglucose reductase, E1
MSFYPLARNNWDVREKEALYRVIESNNFTMGSEVKIFEKQLAKFHNVTNAVMTNSGSSANLLMIAALFESGHLKAGDEVIVPSVSWSTTYFPLHQYNLTAVFVDVNKFGNIDPEKILDAITNKTKAILVVNLLGFPADLVAIKSICDQKNILLLEDNCESFGASSKGQLCGTWGTLGTLSFFYSHHISTMEGGCVLTNNDDLADYLRILRAHGWIRDVKNKDMWNNTGDNFKDSFRFVLPGYCLRPLEFSAAVGQVQLEKWPEQFNKRLANARIFCNVMKNKNVSVPRFNSNSSWFGFPMICESNNERQDLLNRCSQLNIESRPIVTGNFLNQPVVKILNHRVNDKLINAERIDKTGLFFGNDDRDLTEQLTVLAEIIL